jgi:hypothetical protein
MKKHSWRSVRLAPNLRLYMVQIRFPTAHGYDGDSVVAAASPKEARRKMQDLYDDCSLPEEPTFTARLLKVWQEV